MTERVISLISSAAVVISLIFVGFELRQARQLAVADQMNNRMNVVISFIGTYTAANLDFFTAASKAPDNDSLFTSAEKGARNILNIQWTLHENDYFQYSNGLMTESVWEAKLRAIRGDLFVCEMKDIWNWRIGLVEQGFRDILEALPTSCKF